MKAFLLAGLQNGDESKGAIVDALCKEHGANNVVRFNGGAQAAHNVVHDDGTHHTFNQFGCGTFRDIPTHMSRHCLFDPIRLKEEAAILETKGVDQPLQLFTVHEDALIVTPYHKFLNGIREQSRGKNTHGSCGMGIGETMSMNIKYPTSDGGIRVRDLPYQGPLYGSSTLTKLQIKLEELHTNIGKELKEIFDSMEESDLKNDLRNQAQAFTGANVFSGIFEDIQIPNSIIRNSLFEKNLLKKEGNIIFEGAQGVLLDEWLGFHPHTTWSTALYDNALDFLEGYKGQIIRIGVMRAYSTRHGAGPFPSYDAEMTKNLPDRENVENRWQGAFRVGALDIPLLKYAVKMAKPDVIALTCLDRLTDVAEIMDYEDAFLTRTNRKDLVESEKVGQLLSQVVRNSTPNNRCTQFKIYKNDLVKRIERATGKEVAIISRGPSADDKEYVKTEAGCLSNKLINDHKLFEKDGLLLR